MAAATSLIPGLEDIVRGDDPKRRADAARRIAELFLQGAANFRPDHVDLFDGVLIGLVPHTEITARVDLAERLSLLANAPRALVGQLAREDDIAIAGPLLRRSPVIDEQALVEIARAKSQDHLLAMTERPALSPALTDVMIGRGDRDVVRRTAKNAGAQFSPAGYSTLIQRASQDGVLTITVGQRDDLSEAHLKELLAGSIDVIRRRLYRCGQAGAAGRDQAGDGRYRQPDRAGRQQAQFRAGAAHHPRLASGRRTQRNVAARLCQGASIRGIGRGAFGDVRRQDRAPSTA